MLMGKGALKGEVTTSYICHLVDQINSGGIWFGDDPLAFSVPLLLLQLSLVSIFTRSIYFVLKPFGQPLIVSQILGGFILGPSVIGRSPTFATKVFPPKGRALFETLSLFGFMLSVFLIGVKMDPYILLRSGKRAIAVGFLAFSVPYALAGFVAFVLDHFLSLDPDVSSALPFVVALQTLTAFPTVACFLDELRLLNSEIGRLASSSSIVCDVCHWSIFAMKFLTHLASQRSIRISFGFLLSVALFVVIVFFGVRPAVLWAIRQTPEGEPVKEAYVFAVLISVLVCGFIGEVIGLNAFIPSFLLGLVIPDGPPLGAALVEKLDCFVSDILMPIFFTVCGLRMDIFAIQQFKNVATIQLIVFLAFTGKIIGSALPPLFCRMPVLDAISLGLIMNSKGVVELFLLMAWKTEEVLNEECFAIMIISVVIVTGIVSPLVKVLYDPSKRFLAYRRRTILHHRQGEELRMLACVHRQENVSAILDLLAASNPTKESPINLVVLHLIKLVGRASSLLVSHQPREKPSSTQYPSQSERIFNAFHKFEKHYSEHVTVHCFKGISPSSTMHNDVCSLALEKRSTFIIIPFHRIWVNGSVAETSHSLRHLNKNVLEKAPCSVGVLVDRVNRRKYLSSLRINTSLYRVAVLFFGGADDREALAYAGHMSKHSNILTTLFCFSSSTDIVEGSARSKALDTDVLSKFRLSAFRDDRVSFEEVGVSSGEEVLDVLRSMDGAYELIMVGRRHGESWLMAQIAKWKDRGDLGAIGELLASSDIRVAASILVVQQQTRVWGLRDPEESMHLQRDSTNPRQDA
ncbi:cation/H(+) antiporter 15-like [Humulus lupulus]|uniref:cation/H(+) antiporter 15-like n=1 Tax=Humulus lupulus TaxID=3486 RepID=UPI002B410368|nr:cation/H(+) antiporter 15-like [Humulus lupulus]